MKVLMFSGSPKREESVGNKFLNMIKDCLHECDPEIEVDIYIGSECNIIETDGSGNEFVTGKTLYNDDMLFLEKKFLESDFIILSSPVYAHQVSSYMKKLIDRLAYWLHLYRLAGKFGYIISISSNNGNEFVNKYLRSMMEYWGLLVVGESSIETTKINSDQILESYARFICKKILSVETESVIDVPVTQEQTFEIQKENYLKRESGFERDFWKQQGYFEMESFEELFRRKLREKNE